MRNERQYSALTYACHMNQLECFKVIFEHCLEFLSRYKDLKALVETCLGPEKDQKECLKYAIERQNHELLDFLLTSVKLSPNLAASKAI